MKVAEDKNQLRLFDCGDALKLPQIPKKIKIKEVGQTSTNRSEKDLLFDNLISVNELAVIFGLAPQTIRNWIALGKIPTVKIGKKRFFLRRSVQEWLNRKEKPQWP